MMNGHRPSAAAAAASAGVQLMLRGRHMYVRRPSLYKCTQQPFSPPSSINIQFTYARHRIQKFLRRP